MKKAITIAELLTEHAIIAFGLGNPEKFVGADVRLNVYGITNSVGRLSNFGESTLDLHLSRLINQRLWVGAGGYDLIGFATHDPNNLHSFYTAFTHVLPLKKGNLKAFSTLWLTAGVGNGRFRTDKNYTYRA